LVDELTGIEVKTPIDVIGRFLVFPAVCCHERPERRLCVEYLALEGPPVLLSILLLSDRGVVADVVFEKKVMPSMKR
jgi:hypothetical protein